MTAIERGTPVRLAAKVRLRFDERSGKHLLLYPERGLELSESAARIVFACRAGQTTASAIADALAATVGGAARERIETDVLDFLRELQSRGLLDVPAEGQ